MIGLRARVVIAFAVLSLGVALAVSVTGYLFARNYLVAQRESAGITRALLDARALDVALGEGADPGEALASVPAVGGAQALARVGGEWYTRGAGASPPDLPQGLLDTAERAGSAQAKVDLGAGPVFAVAVADGTTVYLELLPLTDLDRALRAAGWAIAAMCVLALVFGAILGAWAGRRLLRPLQLLSDGAVRIASGDLGARLEVTADSDLAPISLAFNDMADAVETRIARERRFVANVSHELRSPVTAVVGTAELLDNHRDDLTDRDAELVSSLLVRSRRLSQTLVDLLEIGSATAPLPLQVEGTDVAALTTALLDDRGHPADMLTGDRPLVRTDARRVERALGNLLDNAAAHGEGLRGVLIERQPDTVLVHVDDAGPGLPEDAAPLFEPFTRGGSGSSDHGAGLGLAIARDAARDLGGDVVADRSPYGGARLTLVIPVDGPA